MVPLALELGADTRQHPAPQPGPVPRVCRQGSTGPDPPLHPRGRILRKQNHPGRPAGFARPVPGSAAPVQRPAEAAFSAQPAPGPPGTLLPGPDPSLPPGVQVPMEGLPDFA
jgi:hypothetical protein